jgi:hypothetical protein
VRRRLGSCIPCASVREAAAKGAARTWSRVDGGHGNKVSADVTWVKDNSAVNSTAAGYMSNSLVRGVLVEDGVMLRVQWQIQF